MKKLLLSSVVAVFAFASAVQAGETCNKDKQACAGKEQTACAAKAAECSAKVTGKSGICPKALAKAKARSAEKGAWLLVSR